MKHEIQPLLEVTDLQVKIVSNKKRPLFPVRGVSFSIHRGECLCLVGESGCGKSITAFSIMRLLPNPPFPDPSGQILFHDHNQSGSKTTLDLLSLQDHEIRLIRGNKISMIFQEPMTALNPVFKVGEQIAEAIMAHYGGTPSQYREQVVDLLRRVGVPQPEIKMDHYPHQLSGGLRQRVMIAMALACSPALLIADEPTTALDVTIQAQILDLLNHLRAEEDLGLLLITHNLGVVARIAQNVLVMYAGTIVEKAPVRELFSSPLHPYTQGLLASVPYTPSGIPESLSFIPGQVPPLDKIPSGCPFRNRCDRATFQCKEELPHLKELAPGHLAACHMI